MKGLEDISDNEEEEDMVLQRRRERRFQGDDTSCKNHPKKSRTMMITGTGTGAGTISIRRQRQRQKLCSSSSSLTLASSSSSSSTSRILAILTVLSLIAMIDISSHHHQLHVLQVVAFVPPVSPHSLAKEKAAATTTTTTTTGLGFCTTEASTTKAKNGIVQSRVICDDSLKSRTQVGHRLLVLHSSSEDDDGGGEASSTSAEELSSLASSLASSLTPASSSSSSSSSSISFRKRVKGLAKRIVSSTPFSLAEPSAIGAVLKDASYAAVEEVEKEIRGRDSSSSSSSSGGGSDSNSNNNDPIIQSIVSDAFAPMEKSLREMDESLRAARKALDQSKLQSYQAIEALQLAAVEQQVVSRQKQKESERQVRDDIESIITDYDRLSELSFEDIDYESSEMAPPFLDPDSCLMPDAEPVVRVEKAPDNSRRIFAGIDISASTDDVWNVLTNYAELQNVIPNLVVNDVLELYDSVDANTEADGDGGPGDGDDDGDDVPEEIKCKRLSQKMKGSLLRQIGGAKVAGINFSAKTTVEVREWPNGMPDFAHFMDDMWDGKSREARAKEYPTIKLKRYRFPRPFAVSNLPTRDISMQSIANDDGEFRLYQGVWRMQPLVGCAPPGQQAMRLTYAVELSPRVYLPVRLVEGRIVQDLCANLEAIRAAVSS